MSHNHQLDLIKSPGTFHSTVFKPVLFLFLAAFGLKCFVGLGNTSEMKKLRVVDCPEGKFYVCVKMYGGGMGDQIRRYCESIPREVTKRGIAVKCALFFTACSIFLVYLDDVPHAFEKIS